MQQDSQQGFTLIEIMLVVTIIGILAAIALPEYIEYSNRSRFTEAVLATGDYQAAFVVQVHSERLTALADADAGLNGIPAAVVQTATAHGMDMVDGVITITWRADGSSLAGTTYTLAAQGITPPIEWLPGGSCYADGYC